MQVLGSLAQYRGHHWCFLSRALGVGVGCDGADGLIHSFRSHLLKYFPPGVPETDMLLQSMHVRVRNGFRDCNLGYGLGYRVHSMSPTIPASCKSGSALTSS